MAIHKILVPTDFSDSARGAVDFAVGLAEKLGASVRLLHVHRAAVEMLSPYEVALPASVYEEAADAARIRFDEELVHANKLRARVEGQVVEGRPSVAILEEAGKVGADLIVMGSRGLTGIKHVVFGSVAGVVVRHAACPVITVRKAEDK